MRKTDDITKIPYCKITPNSIVLYDLYDGPIKRRKENYVSIDDSGEVISLVNSMPTTNNHYGFLSEKATSRLKNSIKYLFWLSGVYVRKGNKFNAKAYKKVSMLTLTLSSKQKHSDWYIKKNMLNQFLIEIRQYNKNLIYVWRAEKQQNGNIHFHILLNIYLPVIKLLSIWNRIQKKEGYLKDYYKKHCNLNFTQYLKLYPCTRFVDIFRRRRAFVAGQQSGWLNPNSIDIVSLKSVKKSYAYISKYISKSELVKLNCLLDNGTIDDNEYNLLKERMKISGRIWYASEQIQKCKCPNVQIYNSLFYEFEKIRNDKSILIKSFDYVSVICISAERLISYGLVNCFNLFMRSFSNININQSFNF